MTIAWWAVGIVNVESLNCGTGQRQYPKTKMNPLWLDLFVAAAQGALKVRVPGLTKHWGVVNRLAALSENKTYRVGGEQQHNAPIDLWGC